MEGTMAQYPPGDPKMIDTIVHQLKSQGIFDQFRKECIADVDTKPAYQNLHQRVEGAVTGFLANQVWRPDMNKNLLRDSLRKHIHESGFLEMGVERIVDQVVNPKVLTVFVPQVEDVVYNFLGLEKPKKSQEMQYSKPPPFSYMDHSESRREISFTDLLPKDLDPISPESDGTKRADNSTEEGELNDDKDEEQSPPFKPIRDAEEHSGGSSLSGISGLTSPDSRHSTISFNGVIKDRPVTPRMSPLETAENTAPSNHLLLRDGGATMTTQDANLPKEEAKKAFVVAEPESSDNDEGSDSSSSRVSSSDSESSSSSYSSSSGASTVELDVTLAKNRLSDEKPVKKDKREVIAVKDERPEKVIRDPRKDDKQEKVDTKYESDAKSLKKVEQGDKEEKVVKKEDKEKKPGRSHEKDDKSTKKHEKEASSIRTVEREDKVSRPSIFDQVETTVKKGTKEEKGSLKIGKEERPIKKDEREEKTLRHSEKDNLQVKEEKLGKSPVKDPKDVKSLKSNDKAERSLHKNGDGKLSSKESDFNKKSAKKDMKDDKLTKTKVDDKIDKTVKRDDKSSKNVEKDVKSMKKEGKHKTDTDSSSQDSKVAEGGKNHSSQKSVKPGEPERTKAADKPVLKDEKSKADKSKSADKSKRDSKSKVKNGDNERAAKEGKTSKHKEGKKGKPTDDHGRHRDKRSDDRGSTDRDSNGTRDRSSSSSRTPGGGAREAGRREKRGGASGGGKTKGGNHDASEKAPSDSSSDSDSDSPPSKKPRPAVDPLIPCKGEYICINNEGKLVLKIKKPKIAANIFEVRKIMQQRRTLAKLEKKRQREFRRAQGISSSDESPVKAEKKRETLSSQNILRTANISKTLQPAEIPEILQPAEIPEIIKPAKIPEIQPAEIPEIIQPAEIPEIIQPAEIPEIIQPAEIPEIIQPTKIAEVVKPSNIAEIEQPTNIPKVMKPAKIPEILEPTNIVKIPTSPTKVPEITEEPAKIPEAIHPEGVPEIVQPTKVPEMIKPAENSTPSEIVPTSEIPLETKSLPVQSTTEDDARTLIEKVVSDICSTVIEVTPPVAAQVPVETQQGVESEDDEPDLKYFESPEVNEYDKLFVSHMKMLDESETLSELDVCSVHSEDLDDLNDSCFSPPEVRRGGIISFVEDANGNDPSNGSLPPVSKTAKVFYTQKATQARTLKQASLGAASALSVSVKSKAEFPKRMGDNASTVPTIRPQLPDDIENVSFLIKSPIPVGALSRHRVNARKTKTKSPPKASPPPPEKRETRRSRKPNSKYSDGGYPFAAEPETKSLPVFPLTLKNQGSPQIQPSEDYAAHGMNNNIHAKNKDGGGQKTTLASLNIKLDRGNMEGEVLPFKDNVTLRLERIIPTPESRTSGGSSSSGSFGTPNEQKPRLGPCRRLGLSRVKVEVARVATPPGADFVMPLSPESDVSASSGDQAKKVSAESLPAAAETNSKQSGAAMTPASRGQRYSSDDLYKPRPLFNRLSRRTRAAAPVADEVAEPSAEVSAAKRRASTVSSADTVPPTKRRR